MCFNFVFYYPDGALNFGAFGALVAGGLPPGFTPPGLAPAAKPAGT